MRRLGPCEIHRRSLRARAYRSEEELALAGRRLGIPPSGAPPGGTGCAATASSTPTAWVAGYELDLVVRRGRTLVFCEVKSKEGDAFGDPLEMVTPEKIRRVRRAAETWLAAHEELSELGVRFDVIAERAGRLEHVPDAF